MLGFAGAFSSVVERCPHTTEVAGSIPAMPTTTKLLGFLAAI